MLAALTLVSTTPRSVQTTSSSSIRKPVFMVILRITGTLTHSIKGRSEDSYVIFFNLFPIPR